MESILATYFNTSPENFTNIKVLDSNDDENLKLIHYDADTISETKPENHLRQVRGMIISNDAVIVPSFGYTPTVITDEFKPDESGNYKLIDKDLHTYNISSDSFKVYPIFDGTLIRVWKKNGKVYASTHKRLDASRSFWGSSGKFLDLFKMYTENYFTLDDLFTDSENVVHNFLLVDHDLLLCSHIDLNEKPGFVLYINSLNGSLPGSIKPVKISVYDIASIEDTFISVNSLDTVEEQNKFLQHGFGQSPEGLLIQLKDRMIKVVHQKYQRRSEIVNNDANVTHRVYTLYTETMFPKSGEDTYLEKFPPTACPNDEQLKEFETKDFIEHSDYKNMTVPSESDLTENNSVETRNRRLLNAVMHYANSLPLVHQVYAIRCYNKLIESRSKVISLLIDDYSKYMNELWGSPSQRDLKVYQRINTMLNEATKFAKTRYTNGERIDTLTERQTIKKFIKQNIKNIVNKEFGENLYKIVRVLITDANKVNPKDL